MKAKEKVKKVRAKCPASCGELIQGLIGDGEKLISLPIDMYSEVTLEEGKKEKANINRKKAAAALKKTFEYFNAPGDYIENISLSINSNIPVAKGMASSTADIAATIIAASELLGKKLNPKVLGELCCSVEPTDSTIFDKLTLFDHINGRIIKKYYWNPRVKVLILELEGTVSTEEFRKRDYSKLRYDNKEKIEMAHKIFLSACKNKDKKLLGRAATISSLANQKILLKPRLREIIEISSRLGTYGVNAAHSGTVIGIIYDEGETDIEKLRHELIKKDITRNYVKIYTANMIQGGVRII